MWVMETDQFSIELAKSSIVNALKKMRTINRKSKLPWEQENTANMLTTMEWEATSKEQMQTGRGELTRERRGATRNEAIKDSTMINNAVRGN